MKILIVGGGGREHAIAWKVRQSPLVTELYCAPGNPGIARIAHCVDIAVQNKEELAAFAEEKGIDFTIVGPELPLSLGIVDLFQQRGLPIFGPIAAAARIEASKAFSKELMLAAGVPTARAALFTERSELEAYCRQTGAPLVLKADGLASGKGVYVCTSESELQDAIASLYERIAPTTVLAEECLFGVEVTLIVATDGERIVPLASAHDYKRMSDGNTGPNTGGMGAISPTPFISSEQEKDALHSIFVPILGELRKRDIPFRGFLYAGLLIPADGVPRVLEFNARLGDPETQAILPRLEGDLVEILFALTTGKDLPSIRWSEQETACAVLAAAGYPDSPRPGDEIHGIDQVETMTSALVFHAGTSRDGAGKLRTAGGRVLNVVARGETAESAVRALYQAADLIQFSGRQLRRDIGGANG